MKTLASIAATLVLASSAFANPCGGADLFQSLSQAETDQLEARIAATPFPQGNLWRASKEGDSAIVVGTLHIPDPRLAELVSRVVEPLFEADALILEATAADELRIAGLSATEPEMFFITEGPSLLEQLGPDDWAIAAQRFQDVGVPAFIGANFRPWYAGLVLSIPGCVTGLVASDNPGLDRRLEMLAEAEEIPVIAIEDAIEVLDVLIGESDAESLEHLRFLLQGELSGGEMTSTMIEAYFDGRSAAAWELGRLMAERELPGEGAALFEEMSQAILIERNRAWEADLPALVSGRDVVIAVGAAHLPGETGVLRALERLGYEISPLP
jgi:uncharacterized protein YbaP (TraB family)